MQEWQKDDGYPSGKSDIVDEGKDVRGAKVEERKESLNAASVSKGRKKELA